MAPLTEGIVILRGANVGSRFPPMLSTRFVRAAPANQRRSAAKMSRATAIDNRRTFFFYPA